eukprot:51459-Eustigmatos_ZCMA.PRE.1
MADMQLHRNTRVHFRWPSSVVDSSKYACKQHVERSEEWVKPCVCSTHISIAEAMRGGCGAGIRSKATLPTSAKMTPSSSR